MTGSVPSCVFSLPLLATLYLNGNGFTGTIPDNIRHNLTNLSIGYNHFSGTIPNSIQNKTNFLYLDLSFNKLTGTLQSGFKMPSNTSYVYMNNNQLSGATPNNFNHIQSGYINLLSGNTFLAPPGSSLPPNDPSYSNYIPGSSDFDIAVYVLASVVGLLLLLGSIAIYTNVQEMKTKQRTRAEGTVRTVSSHFKP